MMLLIIEDLRNKRKIDITNDLTNESTIYTSFTIRAISSLR